MRTEDLIKEEQEILDELISKMDRAVLRLNKQMPLSELQIQKSKGIKDAYGQLIAAERTKQHTEEFLKGLRLSRDSLYSCRLVLECTDDAGTDNEELKVGLHTYQISSEQFIVSWMRPVCRYFLMNNGTEFENTVMYHGRPCKTTYQLKLKRSVDILFDEIKSVVQAYPELTLEEAEQVIADEFLQELLSRRSETEFRNIVFSIQKHQGEIIQMPFRQNLIVQGCAGSGKSMIMLHRLPILLFDNPNNLSRNSIYIITPSQMYIQMAQSMLAELEIQDLQMGTLSQYYDTVIQQYHHSSKCYGQRKDYQPMDRSAEKYIYSTQCIQEIVMAIARTVSTEFVDYSKALYNGPLVKTNPEKIIVNQIIPY